TRPAAGRVAGGTLRSCRPGDAGGAGGTQARRAASGAVRAGLRRDRGERVHRAAACRGVPADRGVRRSQGSGRRARVEELAVSRNIAVVKSRLQRLSPVDGQSEYNRIFGDLVALEQRRKALLERAAGAL